MTRIRRGGFVFVTWEGDHSPRHVHVYSNGRLVVKWDLEQQRRMEGDIPAVVLRLIRELISEGWL